jgi:hypothetical protein
MTAYNLMGTISEAGRGELLRGPVAHWVETLTGFVLELGFDTLVFCPELDDTADG